MLVAPITPVGPSGKNRAVDRLLPRGLRFAASLSRRRLHGHGVRLACKLVGTMLAHDCAVTFRLAGGGTLLVDRRDGLWLRSMLIDGSYEPEIDHFLGAVLDPDDVFVDCGANLGLWSIVAAQIIRDPARVVAVEAGDRQFVQLASNCAANEHTFQILRRAVSTRSGEQVTFFSPVADHVSATMIKDLAPKASAEEPVETVSLLDLLAAHPLVDETDGIRFVKLDIEGMEQMVLSTLTPEAHTDLMVLYEDHGRDTNHSTTRFLLQRGFVARFLAEDGSIEVIDAHTIDRLRSLKNDPARGYNLVAVAPSGPAATRLANRHPYSSKVEPPGRIEP